MKGLLIFLFGWVIVGNRAALVWPLLYNIVNSTTLILIVFLIMKNKESDLYGLLLILILPDFFTDFVLLVSPNEHKFNFLSMLSTVTVMLGIYYDKIPVKWNY